MNTHRITPLLCLAAAALAPTAAWSQDSPERDRPGPSPERMLERLRGGDAPAEARRLRARAAGPERDADQAWRIGVMVDPVDPLLRRHLKLPEKAGVVVDRVVDQSPAAEAGIRPGDIIVTALGKPVGDVAGLRRAVESAATSGKPLVLQVVKEGKKREMRIAPPSKPKPADRDMRPAPGRRDLPPAMIEQRLNAERMGRALREMRAEIDRQREAIRRLERRLDEMTPRRERD